MKETDMRAETIIEDESMDNWNLYLEAEINQLWVELNEYEKASKLAIENRQKLDDLYEAGYIDKFGKPTQFS